MKLNLLAILFSINFCNSVYGNKKVNVYEFINIENGLYYRNLPYRIDVLDLRKSNIIITSESQIKLTKISKNEYRFNASSNGYIYVHIVNKCDTSIIDSIYIETIEVEKSIFFNGNRIDNSQKIYTLDELKEGKFNVVLLNHDIDYSYPIISINMQVFFKDSLHIINTNGNQLGENHYNLLKDIKANMLPILFKIAIGNNENDKEILPTFIFYLKNEEE